MATEPVANRRSFADSLDERVNGVWTEGEMEVNVGDDPLVIGRPAPNAEPEDVGLEEPESEEKNRNISDDSVFTMADQAKMEMIRQEVNQRPSESEEGEVENHLDVTDRSAREAEEGSHLPPAPCKDLPSPAEGGVAPPTHRVDVEVLSDPKEDVASSDSQDSGEWRPTPYLRDPVTRAAVPPVEAEENHAREGETTRKIAEEEQMIPEGQDGGKLEEDSEEVLEISTHTVHRRLSRNGSDDVVTDEPPDGVARGEWEDESQQTVDCKPLDIATARRRWVRLDSTSSRAPQPRSSRGSSSSLMSDAAAQAAICPESQQGEQLPSSRSYQEHDNREATQQVFSQGSLPLATVATEPANQGEAGSQEHACVVKTERQKGEEEREGVGGGQTKGQKESGLNEGKAEEERERKEKVGNNEQVDIEKQKLDRPIPGLNSKDNTASRMDTDSFDDSQSDSGVSADFSPSNTMELNCVPDAPSSSSANETPIEREIRRAVQREQSLRRSRGLQHQTSPQYVDIPLRKSILTQPLPSKFESSQTKDRYFAGKKMQKEIRVETQREQVLVQLGKIPGFYDKGTVRQLKERKKLFEAFQEPKDDSCNLSLLSVSPSWASDLSSLELPADDSSEGSTIGGSFAERRRSLDLLSWTQSPCPDAAMDGGFTYIPHRGPGLTEETKNQVIILENPPELSVPTLYHAKRLSPSESSDSLTLSPVQTVVDSTTVCASSTDKEDSWRRSGSQRNAEQEAEEEEEEEEEEDVPRENPFFKLRSSVAVDIVEQDIREARERERELRRLRSSMFRGAASGDGASGDGASGDGASGDGAGDGGRLAPSPTPPTTPTPTNGLAAPDAPVTPLRMSSGTLTVRQSLGKLGIWPPPQSSEEEFNQLEVIQSSGTPRQKTPLLQRWEAGLVNGHREGEED